MSRRNVLYTCIAVFVWAGLAVSFAGAQTVWHVDDDAPGDPAPGDPSVSDPLEDGSPEHPFDAIQEGIDAASDGDTVLVSGGYYYGDGNKNLDFQGKAITVRSSSYPSNTTIYCGHDGRAFHFHSGEGEESVVQGFTITGAYVPDIDDGAILCEGAGPSIVNCDIVDNTCTAIYVEDGNPVIQYCLISENLGGWACGGIVCSGGDLTVTDSTIQRNAATWTGGIAVSEGDLVLEGCEIKYNLAAGYAAGPGGIAVEDADVVITDCVIEGNTGGWFGGGMCANRCTLTVTDSVIAQNVSEFLGGGLYSHGGEATLMGCVIADNYAREAGGGILADGTPLILTDCAITDNATEIGPGFGGGGLLASGSDTTITGCTITGNTGPAIDKDSGSLTIRDSTISDNDSPEKWCAGILCWSHDATLENCTIARNIGYALGGLSFDGDELTMTGCTITDNVATGDPALAGGARVYCNTVTISGCTIADNLITGWPGVAGGVEVGSTSGTISDCTITGNFGGRVGSGGVAVGGEVTIRNCTIEENSSIWGVGGIYLWQGSHTIGDCLIVNNSGEDAGGVFSWYGSPTIVNCLIAGNSARNGGGVLAAGSTVTVVGCTITENYAPLGAGLCFGGCDATVVGCTITSNVAGEDTQAGGGGICFEAGELLLANCLLAENTAVGSGGGAWLHRCRTTITNCAIVDNTSEAEGGGIRHLYDGDVTLVNSTVWGNAAGVGPQIGVGWPGYATTLSAHFSDVEGGEAAVYVESGSTLDWGPGNLDADPLFVDRVGGDYHLLPGSPCIDAGCNCGVLWDKTDLDGDGDTSEYLPFDLDGEGRFFDDPDTLDSGSGWPPIVDIGPYEFGNSDVPPCFGDVDGDRTVGLGDLAVLLDNYGTTTGAAGTDGDLNCDGRVNLTDLAALLGVYGSTCD